MPNPGLVAHQVKSVVKTFLSSRTSAGDTVILGVSGGADSLALAASCSALQDELSVTFVPVIIDHQLQVGSGEVAQAAKAACQTLGLTAAEIHQVEVTQNGDGVEAAARKARYEALRKSAEQHEAVGIMIAHSLNDQAETVLMRLSRGSGTRSLAAMSADKDGIWRPLLDVTRADLRISLDHYGLTVFDDPHNLDRRFTRVRVRLDVMPALRAALGDDVDFALARTAALSFDDAQALDALAAGLRAEAEVAGELVIAALAQAPRALVSRVVKTWLESRGVPIGALSFEHITAVTRLIIDPRVGSTVRVAGGVEVVRQSGRLRA